MSGLSQAPAASLIPAMRYRDLDAAVAWLCDTFDFGRDHVASADDGTTVFAQLRFGSSLIMLGPVSDSEIDRFMRQPDEIGGAETQSCYLVVENIQAHRERAVAAGAEVLVELKDFDHGGKGYSCRDPQGHIWNFGTYVPVTQVRQRSLSSSLRPLMLVSAAITIIGVAFAGGVLISETNNSGSSDKARAALGPDIRSAPVDTAGPAPPASPSTAIGYTGIAAKYAAMTAGEQLKQMRRMAIAKAALRRSRIEVERLRQAEKEATHTRQRAEQKLLTERRARLAQEERARGAERQLAMERVAKENAERAALELRKRLESAEVVIPPLPKPAVAVKPKTSASQGKGSHRAAAKASEQASDAMPGFIP